MNVRVFDGAEAVAEAAAAHFAEVLPGRTGLQNVVLSGGSTPKLMYQILASPAYAESIAWDRICFWWGDERWVPPTDPDSNERMARKALLNHVPVPRDNIWPMYWEGESAVEAADLYEQALFRFVGFEPAFDLVLLGLGPDAHTASMFPGDPSISETKKLVVASAGAAGVKQRITLTPAAINKARQVLFLVVGQDKAEPLRKVLNDDYDPTHIPAQVVARNAPDVLWFIDEAAASLL